ncbi:exopolyphosphatase [Flammeovirga yaeyamensis]|uniref:Exopolyphosphatase n=1 Tax=Flammeovirga yaeyamensis TaxID=367791 RepID=A0AAX1N1V5_9BACT|nr:exopolyphosphatase [Flammeovirga yaeyamensis]MBB3701548.1 exopolyphosphatase/guanosine-5'-triphosphate,3'-diphosphate pyrophosphatase [Flammeovirga yaeyamensis]NMF38692.1 exopolyphosphatase [Flammeovirga yaeyamensis]QWG01558.1 exopolyphosphatase [Flammeovirga yaeyamensis]
MTQRKASIDMGTNTFQLLIGEVEGHDKIKKLYTEDIFVRLGKGGISDGYITEKAQQRAFDALGKFHQIISEYDVVSIEVAATSAVRVAKNGVEFREAIKSKFNFDVNIIQGDEEAEVIYYGVRSDISIEDTAIIMDIGGGSTEFIICDSEKVLWKESFEVGAQRLFDSFCKIDPIASSDKEALFDYVENRLMSLWDAVGKYQPKKIIGAAGTFHTIQEVYGAYNNVSAKDVQVVDNSDYDEMYEKFVGWNREERFKIKGLIPQRVDMVVPASCLLKCVLDKLSLGKLFISSASLREGLLLRTK